MVRLCCTIKFESMMVMGNQDNHSWESEETEETTTSILCSWFNRTFSIKRHKHMKLNKWILANQTRLTAFQLKIEHFGNLYSLWEQDWVRLAALLWFEIVSYTICPFAEYLPKLQIQLDFSFHLLKYYRKYKISVHVGGHLLCLKSTESAAD